MSDFCNKCSRDMGFDKPDIDLVEESKDIQPGYSKGPYLCEGCGYIYLINHEGTIRVDNWDPTLADIEMSIDFSKLPTLEDYIK